MSHKSANPQFHDPQATNRSTTITHLQDSVTIQITPNLKITQHNKSAISTSNPANNNSTNRNPNHNCKTRHLTVVVSDLRKKSQFYLRDWSSNQLNSLDTEHLHLPMSVVKQ